MNKDVKATEYKIEPIVTMLRSAMISDGGTEKKAKELEGKWIELNKNMFAFEEAGKVTVVYSDTVVVGCACGRCNNNVMCEHIIAFEALKSPPQLMIKSPDYRWLQTYLFSKGWFSDEDRRVYPTIDDSMVAPEGVAELPPIDESKKLDPVHEDKPLDIGVSEEPEPTMYERKCMHCGFVSKGHDIDEVKRRIDEHRSDCPKNSANKKRPPLMTQDAPEQSGDVTVDETDVPIVPKPTVAKDAPVEKPSKKVDKKAKPPSNKTVSLYDWVENLIEFGVGQIFGDTGTAKTAFCREVAEQAADEGKKVVYWDTEGNMTRAQRAAMAEHKNITYILDRDWAHIKNMLSSELSKGSPKLPKCDLFILDSIGVPVLGIYGTLKQNQKGNALQAMQGLLYELTKFAETNEAVVIVTNQPVSEMNKTEAERADRHPFGDKAMFFTKEILKIVGSERNEYKTVCKILAWRSRSAGRGKILCTVTVSDNGVEVTPTGGE